MADNHPNAFRVWCCGARRMALPGNVTVCESCDVGPDQFGTWPNWEKLTRIPTGDPWTVPTR